MSRRELDQTLDVLTRMDRAVSSTEIVDIVLKVAFGTGAEFALAGTIPRPGLEAGQQRSHVLLERWPKGWCDRYFSHGYLYRDPAIQRVLSASVPFTWSELAGSEPGGQQIMDEAGDFRLKQGFTVALVTLEGEAAGFSLAGERIEVTPQGRGMLTLIATYAIGRALFLKDDRPPISLTLREREALQWSAEGKTTWEIGELMSISEHGADKHLRTAKAKLGASTKVHAVATAIRHGVIS